jgi:hypothetical protein
MKIPRILVVPIWVAIVAAFATLVGFIAFWLGAYNPQAWGFFTLIGIFGAMILYVFGRQIYWWFAGKGDYAGGGFPRLWKKITGK